MSYEHVDYTDVEPLAPGMHFLRDALNCEKLGITIIEADEGWTGKEHDHADEGQEEVYLLLSGSATLTVEGEPLTLSACDAVRVDPADSRQLVFEEDDSRMVVTGSE